MTVAIVGKPVRRDLTIVYIVDEDNKQEVECVLDQESLDDLVMNETAIFVGNYNGEQVQVERISLRKFLEPLYEQDVMENSNFALVDVIDNPFPKAYEKA